MPTTRMRLVSNGHEDREDKQNHREDQKAPSEANDAARLCVGFTAQDTKHASELP